MKPDEAAAGGEYGTGKRKPQPARDEEATNGTIDGLECAVLYVN